VVSHGAAGSLRFGNHTIDAAALHARTTEVSAWSRSLAANADVLLYGCSVAGTEKGNFFVRELARLTHANVAASTDRGASGKSLTRVFD
jgi:maleate cis-trans isomerase